MKLTETYLILSFEVFIDIYSIFLLCCKQHMKNMDVFPFLSFIVMSLYRMKAKNLNTR